MSVEKFIPAYEAGNLKHEPKPYTQILNKVLQGCRNLEALALWCYLQSKPENWEVNPQQLAKHFNIGRDKVYSLLNFLITSHLLLRQTQISPDGKFKKVTYTIKNGEDFIQPVQPLPENKEVAFSPLPDLPDTANQDYINKRKSKNKSNVNTKRVAPTKRRTSVCENFVPNEKHIQMATEFNLNLDEEKQKFIDYYLAHGKPMANWNASFNNWLRKAHIYQLNSGGKQKVDHQEIFKQAMNQPSKVKGNIYDGNCSRI